MKKNLLYVLMMACMFSFFTACGDDDDPDEPDPTATTWKDGVGSYTGDQLSINEGAPTSGQTVAIATGSGDNAKITLTNLVPEAATVEFDNVAMTKADANYTFKSETKVGTTTIGIEGTLSGIPATKATDKQGMVMIKVTRKIDASIAGTWKLGFTEGEAPIADFRLDTDMKFSDDMINALIGSVDQLVGAMIGGKVSAVNVKLSEAGLFDVSWVKQGTTEEIDFKTALGALNPGMGAIKDINIFYFTEENNFYLAFDKGTFAMIEIAGAAMLPEGLSMAAIKEAFFVDRGGYYAMPISIKKEDDNSILFYTDKDKILTVFNFMKPILPGLLGSVPEEMRPLVDLIIEEFPESLAAATRCNIGLGFTR